jgi:hypothetical protein
MHRKVLLGLCLLLALAGTATAETKKSTTRKSTTKETSTKEPAAKELSGMSIVGNDEAPKALYIVPWKSSELGVETGFSRMSTESAVPVDRDVFMRQLNFFEVSTKK